MKKIYVSPKMNDMLIETNNLCAISDGGAKMYRDADDVDASKALGRRGRDWDDED